MKHEYHESLSIIFIHFGGSYLTWAEQSQFFWMYEAQAGGWHAIFHQKA
jgi:hypothetical protein